MIYKFKSPATGDLIMMGPQGDQMLRLIGREPAPQGIIEVAAMAAAIAALNAALHAALQPAPAADKKPAQAAEPGAKADAQADTQEAAEHSVGLRQRVWPMLEMLRRAQAAEAAVVWGV